MDFIKGRDWSLQKSPLKTENSNWGCKIECRCVFFKACHVRSLRRFYWSWDRESLSSDLSGRLRDRYQHVCGCRLRLSKMSWWRPELQKENICFYQLLDWHAWGNINYVFIIFTFRRQQCECKFLAFCYLNILGSLQQQSWSFSARCKSNSLYRWHEQGAFMTMPDLIRHWEIECKILVNKDCVTCHLESVSHNGWKNGVFGRWCEIRWKRSENSCFLSWWRHLLVTLCIYQPCCS